MLKNRIGEVRKENGIPLKFIATKLDVSYQTVSNWCNNRSQPDLIQAAYIARILHVSLNDLIEEREKFGEEK